jgi:hypothetical protein
MTLAISPAHQAARLAGTLSFADAGVGNSRIRVYATTQPATGVDAAGAPLVEILLAKPCGTIAANVLTLIQAEPSGDLIMETGTAIWARWINGSDEMVADGSVSDGAGEGDFKLSGTTGTVLYAGAYALLGECTLT